MYAGVGELHACTVPKEDTFGGAELRLILEFSALCALMTNDTFGSSITDSSWAFHSWCMLAQGTSAIVRKKVNEAASDRPFLKVVFKNVIQMANA
jgi:hypothetical protein